MEYRLDRTGGVDAPAYPGVTLVHHAGGEVVLTVDGVTRRFAVAVYPDATFVDSDLGSVRLVARPRFPTAVAAATAGSLLAPMPGAVVRVGVAVGDTVAAGTPLVWLEAMKMEHVVRAPASGRVTELHARPGLQVEAGTVLAVVTTEEE